MKVELVALRGPIESYDVTLTDTLHAVASRVGAATWSVLLADGRANPEARAVVLVARNVEELREALGQIAFGPTLP